MKVWILALASTFVFMVGGCLRQGPVDERASLSSVEQTQIAAIKEEFKKHGLGIVEEMSHGRQVAATLMHRPKMEHGHECRHEKGHECEHEQTKAYIHIMRAEPDEEGNYADLAINLGGTYFVYKGLYIARIEDDAVTITKSVATDDTLSRHEAPVEKEIIDDMALAMNGTVEKNMIVLNAR